MSHPLTHRYRQPSGWVNTGRFPLRLINKNVYSRSSRRPTSSRTYFPRSCHRSSLTMRCRWDGETEPWYGDVCAIRSGDYIYAYGHAKRTPFVYLARVSWRNATDLSCYEYWNGDTWQIERLYNPGDKEGVFWQINQGQVIYSSYYDCFIFIYCGTSFCYIFEGLRGMLTLELGR
jgi:hypothetical protein